MAKTKPLAAASFGDDPPSAPGSPSDFRARVRMYRQGLGDCFLLTLPRKTGRPCQVLIDCGVLSRDEQHMQRLVGHLRDTVREESAEKAQLDVVVATHEHQDHLSGFNQARELFNQDFKFGSVWLGWTENLTQPEIKQIKEAKTRAKQRVEKALTSNLMLGAVELRGDLESLLQFGQDDDTTASRKISDALEYLKLRGREAEDLRYLEPGQGPFTLDGVDDVRVYVLGPPRDPILLKGSEVTEQMKRDNVVYHLSAAADAGMLALDAALSAADAAAGEDLDRYHPFNVEHRIAPRVPDCLHPGRDKPSPHFAGIQRFVEQTYDDDKQAWRRIDHDWLSAFGQLALDLDSDTNNTSLVLAFEFISTGEVLLFVGDAQVGNWRSWANVEFTVPGRDKPLPALDLLRRTVFYKVGHHCSHNATLKNGGLELMKDDGLVAFIPLDRATAASKGAIDKVTNKPRGWPMPADPLFKALQAQAKQRVVISDVTDELTPEAKQAGVLATGTYIDYFLK